MRAVFLVSLLACTHVFGCAASVGNADGDTPHHVDASLDSTRDVVSSDTSSQDRSAYGHVLYLAFNGESVPILTPRVGSVSVPPFMETAPDSSESPSFVAAADSFDPGWRERRQTLIDAVANKVRAIVAPYDVQVVTRRPPFDTGFYRLVIGGDDLDYEQPSRCGSRVGMAALLCDPPNLFDPNAAIRTGSVLTNCIDPASSPVDRIASTALHEFGHASSLEHIDTPRTIMYSMGSDITLGWGAGTVVPFGTDMNGTRCGLSAQDGHAVLLSVLGAHRDRRSVPTNLDSAPPVWTRMLPANGDRIPPNARPCVRVSDASEVVAVRVETFQLVVASSVQGMFRRANLLGTATTPPDGVLDPIAISQPETLYIRYTASDKWGNLAEERVRVTVDPNAPPLQCPTM